MPRDPYLLPPGIADAPPDLAIALVLDDVARADAGRTDGLAVRQAVGGGQPGTGGQADDYRSR